MRMYTVQHRSSSATLECDVSSDDLPDKQGRLALKAQQSGNMRLGKSAPICSLIEDIRDNLDGLPAFGILAVDGYLAR